MNDVDRKMVEQLRTMDHPDTHGISSDQKSWDLLVLERRAAATYIEAQTANNKRLRELGHRLELALDAIDIVIMPSDQRESDTKAVGGPVSDYGIDYDAQGVVQRVRAFVESQATEIEHLRRPKKREQAMMPLFQDARDAIVALTKSQCKLHHISPDLADRMDDVGILERWEASEAESNEGGYDTRAFARATGRLKPKGPGAS